jgi:hypothetical protein
MAPTTVLWWDRWDTDAITAIGYVYVSPRTTSIPAGDIWVAQALYKDNWEYCEDETTFSTADDPDHLWFSRDFTDARWRCGPGNYFLLTWVDVTVNGSVQEWALLTSTLAIE